MHAEKVKILIVMDSAEGKSSFAPARFAPSGAVSFGLFEFCRVLERTEWRDFDLEITRAHRRPLSSPTSDADAMASAAGAIGPVQFSFRFTPATLSRASFDALFLFGVQGTKYLLYDNERSLEVSADEAAVIARFMDSGGGVFATGDHEDLGIQLSGKVPRVRSMRRWYYDYA